MGSYVNENKKKCKNSKIENFVKRKKKKKKRTAWRYGGQGVDHKIWSGPMQRFLRNLSLPTTNGRPARLMVETDRRTTDACETTVALLCSSARAARNRKFDTTILNLCL